MPNSTTAPLGREANWLLGSLPPKEYRAIDALAETVELPRNRVLFEVEQLIPYAYFPQSGCLSCVSYVDDGCMVETAAVGFEGLIGVSLVNGISRVPGKCFVQIAGVAKRIPREAFVEALRLLPHLSRLAHGYSQVSADLSAQTTACTARHTILQRCAKWLLCTHDKMQDDVVPLTQEFLAIMLGVRRASVTDAAEQLRRDGIISYARGQILIVDRARLEAVSCGCYRAMHGAYRNGLPDTYRAFARGALSDVPTLPTAPSPGARLEA